MISFQVSILGDTRLLSFSSSRLVQRSGFRFVFDDDETSVRS